MDKIEQVLEGFDNCIDPRYFVGDERFTSCAEQYRIRGIRAHATDYVPLEKIIFHPHHTPYGLVLRGPNKGAIVDSAVLGFTVSSDVADCLEIHGGQGMYKVLTPIRWDMALLGELVQMGKIAGLEAITVIPAQSVDGMTHENHARLERRYDFNALSLGFRYSRERDRFVLDL